MNAHAYVSSVVPPLRTRRATNTASSRSRSLALRSSPIEVSESRSSFTTAFGGQVEEQTAVCKVGTKTYKAGESYPDADGCNTCTCSKNGYATCTELFCGEPEEKPVEPSERKLGDETYKAGESFPASDGCNVCKCQKGGYFACTEKFCG